MTSTVSGPWTQFMDMHSGGGQKLDWPYIYIQAPQEQAEAIFYNRFGRNPHRVTCTCCGPDYSITESEDLQQATAYERGCAYVYRRPDGSICDQHEGWTPGKGTTPGYTSGYAEIPGKRYGGYNEYLTLDEYIATGKCKFIYATEIGADERKASLPDEGYVWAGG